MIEVKTAVERETSIKENLEFILNHLSDPLFPRTIMTRAHSYQKEVFNAEEALVYFKASNYEDCRINAYPSYTEYQGINLTAPSFIMMDLDLKDFQQSQEKLNKILSMTLNKLNGVFYGAEPTVLWTGGGYHIYQPIHGFVLEEIDRFACLRNPHKKDLTSRFMQFAKDYFTDKKSDPQHRPSVKSCLIRIPGTINSKYNQEVIIVQKWNRFRPPIQYLLRNFRTWLVSENINDKEEEKRSWNYRSAKNIGYNSTSTILWIEKLLQTPIADHRKYAVWRILVPYLFNIRRLSAIQVTNTLHAWLNKCDVIRALDFNMNYLIRSNVRNGEKNRHPPISLNKLSSENQNLYAMLF